VHGPPQLRFAGFALGPSELYVDFMMAIVKNAHENLRSTVYDKFQRREYTSLQVELGPQIMMAWRDVRAL
jgi:hypothetical protein